MWVLFLIFAFLAGLALPIQFSINAQLRTVVGSPLVVCDYFLYSWSDYLIYRFII